MVAIKRKGALTAPGLKIPKPTKRTLKKHLDNPPEIYTLQGRHILNNSGSHLCVFTRTTPSNGPL
jgi:hypothetical protein